MPNYRSKLEEMVHGLLGVDDWAYEPFKVRYSTPHSYTPDLVTQVRGDYQILVEIKGYFRPGDTQKYKAIKKSLDAEDLSEGPRRELVFFLSSPFKKVRKGAMLTMAQWCEKEGFPWFVDGVDLQEYVREGAK